MKIAKILKSSHALTADQGEKIRDKIIKKLHQGKRVNLDFSGLHLISSHFIYPISDLVLISKEKFEKNVRFTNMSKFHTQLTQQCINESLKKSSENIPLRSLQSK